MSTDCYVILYRNCSTFHSVQIWRTDMNMRDIWKHSEIYKHCMKLKKKRFQLKRHIMKVSQSVGLHFNIVTIKKTDRTWRMDDKNEECVQNCGRKGSIVLFFITIFRVQKKRNTTITRMAYGWAVSRLTLKQRAVWLARRESVDCNQMAHHRNTEWDPVNTAINFPESKNSGSPVQERMTDFVFERNFTVTVEAEDWASSTGRPYWK
jgi:hypothetical protein